MEALTPSAAALTSITIAEDLITGPDILSLLAASGAGTASSNARQIRWHADKLPFNAIQRYNDM